MAEAEHRKRTIAVFGASGSVGQQVVRQAQARGHAVRAIEKEFGTGPDMPPGVEQREADITKPGLAEVFEGCDAVISAIGVGFSLGNAADPPPLYTEGAVQTIHGMREAGIKRLIVISATFVATRERGPIWFRAAAKFGLERIFTQMEEMERVLRVADDIDWTAVRPGWLMEGDLTRDYTVAESVIPGDLIRTRHADLAHFMLDCLEQDLWVRGFPAIARDEPTGAAGPDALLKELFG